MEAFLSSQENGFVLQGVEHISSHMLSKHPTTELEPSWEGPSFSPVNRADTAASWASVNLCHNSINRDKIREDAGCPEPGPVTASSYNEQTEDQGDVPVGSCLASH